MGGDLLALRNQFADALEAQLRARQGNGKVDLNNFGTFLDTFNGLIGGLRGQLPILPSLPATLVLEGFSTALTYKYMVSKGLDPDQSRTIAFANSAASVGVALASSAASNGISARAWPLHWEWPPAHLAG